MILPTAFESYTKNLMGTELYANFLQVMQQEPTAFIRLNPYKCPHYQFTMPTTPVAWCGYGYALKSKPQFTFDPLFHAGLYYVQEQSSMFLAHVLQQCVNQPVRMLDMCAAPGGKSTLARIQLPEGSILVCNEPIATRAQILAENIQKCGHPEVIVTNNYPKEIRKAKLKFDVILCDVPCSGEGMFRKNANAINEWSIENVNKCQQLQREIITEAWQCLTDGGILIYSTCTFNTKENEENVAWICNELGAKTIEVPIKEDWKIKGGFTTKLSDGNKHTVFRFIPGYKHSPNHIYGEGLFVAVLRKDGTLKSNKKDSFYLQSSNIKQHHNKAHYPTQWLNNEHLFNFLITNNQLTALPHTLQPIYTQAAKHLRILSAGIPMAIQKGKNLIPTQALALSICLNKKAFPCVDLSYCEAIAYLSKNTITLPNNTPQGFVLVTFRHIPLGWMKNMGNRANNLYPNEWRIRSTHHPENEIKVIDV